MLLTNLAEVARRTGFPVEEVPGWKSRGHGQMRDVRGIVCHHTGTAASAAGDYPSLRIVRDGRSDLPGPLSHLGLGRNGTIYVIAAGKCSHAGGSRSAPVVPGWENGSTIGIEAEHPGGSAPWPKAQMQAYRALCRELALAYGLSFDRVRGHKEIALPLGRKPDPNFDMSDLRASLAGVATQQQQQTPEEDPLVSRLIGLEFVSPNHHPQDVIRLDLLQLLLSQAGGWIAPHEDLVTPDRNSQERYTNLRNVLGTYQIRTDTGGRDKNGNPVADFDVGPKTAASLASQKKVI